MCRPHFRAFRQKRGGRLKRIVIAEDDRYLRDELIFAFQKAGYDAKAVLSFEHTAEGILQMQPDLVVLDLNLPGKSGYEICRTLKARVSAPVLILTARDSLRDELKGLELGADDYLTKPCPPARLLARAERLIQPFAGMKSFIKAGTLLLDTDTWKLSSGQHAVILAENEGKIMRRLMEGSPSVVSKEELCRALWGSAEYVDENILQVNISRLRKKLAESGFSPVLENIRGKGYALRTGE